jgi:hypothetical protein
VHEQLAQQVHNSASVPVGFNNALIENYTNAYTTMVSSIMAFSFACILRAHRSLREAQTEQTGKAVGTTRAEWPADFA